MFALLRAGLRLSLLAAVVVCLGWALVRTLGLDRGYPLTALIAFTPYAALASAATLVLCLLARRRVGAGLAALALALLAIAILPRALGGADPAGAGTPLTVIALNLHNGQADADELVGLVRERDADLLCLSELTPEALAALERAGIGELLPESHLLAAPAADGTGIFARGELVPLPGVAPGLGETPMARAELTTLAGASLDVTSVHPRAPIDGDSAERWQDGLAALPEAAEPGIQLLAGDFNATLDHRAFREVLDRGYADAADAVGAGLAATWPVRDSGSPPLTIDHLLAEEGTAVGSFATAEVAGSDHRAVIAELALAPG